jgi:hypothetical protein
MSAKDDTLWLAALTDTELDHLGQLGNELVVEELVDLTGLVVLSLSLGRTSVCSFTTRHLVSCSPWEA